ncbi:adenylylsulfate kinase [Maridesulfovibrio ferrireducens]|uniref:Adenylyl-sulfate kinase n=1 Tax=Maridesulfovibrio ferrireducens TaxID=246191 RepID=A0A1G9CL80_9BACT|nr:adenylyl-sulfate kinase [Maridesulfovibrio ferrireducens]SDK52427.1 adenylylsulfate kinase [Maridesulfovibrio ferrireducens]
MNNRKNIKRYRGSVNREDREKRNKHKSAVFWMTGLSGSGKSTIAHAVEKKLFDMGILVYVFDGDNVRHGVCDDLDFSQEDRTENIRRISEVAKLFVDLGSVCFCAFITPLESDRSIARNLLGDDFKEIHVDCSLEKCEKRDTKGYYAKARAGSIQSYTGISAPYNPPKFPDLLVNTDTEVLSESVDKVISFVLNCIQPAMD